MKTKCNPYTQNHVKILCFCLLAISVSCSKEDNPPVNKQAEELNEQVLKPQLERYTLFSNLVKTMDTVSAVDSVYKVFVRDTSVSHAIKSEQGISVIYKNGLHGGIFIDPLRKHPANDNRFQKNTRDYTGNSKMPYRIKNTVPGSKKAIFINPIYFEEPNLSDYAMDNSLERLPMAGFNLFDNYINETANLDLYTKLDSFGYIQFDTHGCAWPKTDSITDVYMLTGQEFNSQIYNKYNNEFMRNEIIILTFNSKNTLFINPDFLINNNDFEIKKPLIYAGFCFSFLADWPELFYKDGAGGYFGFDWAVYSTWCIDWNYALIRTLTDTTKTTVNTVLDWYDNDMQKYYWDEADKRNVNIYYTGEPDLALIEEDEPAISDLDYTECILNCRVHAEYDHNSVISGNDTSYTYWSNRYIFDEYKFDGSFSGNTYTGIYYNQFDDELYDYKVTITLNSTHNEIISLVYDYDYTSSTKTVTKDLTAENIPLMRKDAANNELFFGIEESSTCTSITALTNTTDLDWEEADIFTNSALIDFNCNEFSFFTVEFK